MRIWLVPMSVVSDRHVLGQHRELHMLVSMIKSPRFKNHPLVKFYGQHLRWLVDFHAELVDEIRHRFGSCPARHRTPMPVEWSEEPRVEIAFPQSWIDYDREDLAYRYATMYTDHVWSHRERLPWTLRTPDQVQEPTDHIPLYRHMSPGKWGEWTGDVPVVRAVDDGVLD